jgi:hypothetical protein
MTYLRLEESWALQLMNANSRYTCTNGSEVQREFPQWGVVGSAFAL